MGELIRRTLSEVLSRGEIHDPDLNRMSITVSEVRVTPDLRIATAFVLPLGGKDKEEALQALARNKGEIRHAITKQMSVKHSPDIRFMLDDTFDRMDETNRLFASEAVRRDLASDDDAGED
ncbi:Ribosome-binding factor A [Litoreibacter arenae DSM 19593]|uniref:Ribosome-binding factor A n=1 Tax=Litoreibacter arenae DSM 19593 TaxID=1123360 RepID=S9RIB1_9RHOB|nr:Ribosome-binding factor A [Litoreibacter arenae DSM 19593]